MANLRWAAHCLMPPTAAPSTAATPMSVQPPARMTASPTAMTACPATITAGPNDGGRVRAARRSINAVRGPMSPRTAASATVKTASTWSSRSFDSPVDATSVRESCIPGSVMISAVGSTMTSAPLTPLARATRTRQSLT